MSVTPAAAFGLKGDDPGVLALKGILVVKLPIWNPRALSPRRLIDAGVGSSEFWSARFDGGRPLFAAKAKAIRELK